MRKLIELVLDLTDRCPAKCIFCSANSGPDKNNFMPAAIVHDVIADAAELGAKIVAFSGGEPLLHPNIVDFVKFSKDMGIEDVRVFSSGLTTPDIMVDLAGAGLDKILFNLQASRRSIHFQFSF